MVDIHTHILPNVDDGSKSLEISLKLLENEIKNGVTDVFLTPHQNAMNLSKDMLKESFLSFKNNINNLNINIYLGSEIYYYDKLLTDIKEGKILTMNNTNYILVEFSTRFDENVVDKLYDLVVSGYIPIVAHIERYPYLGLKDYEKIHKLGAKIQVNTKTFNEKFFKKNLKYLLNNNFIDFIGTDCHDLEKRNVSYELENVLKKYPKFKEKLDENEKILLGK